VVKKNLLIPAAVIEADSLNILHNHKMANWGLEAANYFSDNTVKTFRRAADGSVQVGYPEFGHPMFINLDQMLAAMGGIFYLEPTTQGTQGAPQPPQEDKAKPAREGHDSGNVPDEEEESHQDTSYSSVSDLSSCATSTTAPLLEEPEHIPGPPENSPEESIHDQLDFDPDDEEFGEEEP
jgi:hypothetical protein